MDTPQMPNASTGDRRDDPANERGAQQLRGELAAQKDHNARLIATLRDAREQIVTLKAEVDRLGEPPSGYGTFLELHDDGSVDIMASGKKMRVAVSPSVDASSLRPGQELMLNEALNVVADQAFEVVGEIVTLKEVLSDRVRALVAAGDGMPDAARRIRALSGLFVPSEDPPPKSS